MFYLNKETQLTEALLQKIINKFTTEKLPILQQWKNYYDGKHAILSKTYSDASKPCNRIVTNFAKIIADTYNGYICGKPVSYTSPEDITAIQDTINYNDSTAEDIAWCRNALIFGVGYELQWLDEFSQTRYTQVSPLNCFAICDSSLDSNLLYFVRWYEANAFDDSETIIFEVYSSSTIKKYQASGLNGSLTFIEETAHYFNDVPVSIFTLNESEESIFNSIITLNDSYNTLQSAEIDDYQAWVDCYLVLEGVDADAEDIAKMKENRAMLLPSGATASWLTKNANDTQIVNILDNIKKNIFKVSACPDMADETFLAQSGTALAYKLVGFENVASGIVTNFTRAIQRRIELICNVLNLKADDAVWRDVNINFVRNLPVDITSTVQLINSLKGTVSDRTLLAQLPFIDDVEAELELVEAQKQANMNLFTFGLHESEEEKNTETLDEEG